MSKIEHKFVWRWSELQKLSPQKQTWALIVPATIVLTCIASALGFALPLALTAAAVFAVALVVICLKKIQVTRQGVELQEPI